MTFSISTIAAGLSLLLVVSANAAVNINIKQTRQSQSNLRHVKGAMRNPEANDRNEQEALTREDIMEQSGQQQQPVQQVQTSQLQQKQAVAQKQEQQLLQAQAAQMKQMQQQLLKQQQELQRLQQLEQKRPAQPAARPTTKRARAPKKALVGVKAKMMTKSELGSESGAASSGIAKPKGWDQCLKFARFVKTKDVTGVELVRTWKSTCEPAVQSGRATERYKLMCNSLSGVVEPYAAQIDYDVEQLCDSVLAVFHDVTAVDVKG